MLHDPISLEDADPFLTLPRLRPCSHPDRMDLGHGPAHSATPLSARGDNGVEVGGTGAPPASTFSPALVEIAALRAEQILKWGHTPEKDAALPVGHLPREAHATLAAACDDIQFHRTGPAFAEARPRIRKRLLKAGAMIAAALDRLDAEPDDSADWPSL